MSKRSILKGTLILTLAGFLTRFIGFFYRIYLSQAIGAENMGVYQLIFTVYSICFTLYAVGIQTSISRLVAAQIGQNHRKNSRRILLIGIIISVSIAISCSIITYFGSGLIASRFLAEPRCASSLRILALIFPFCGMTACINGYYYGLKKTFVPASTQLLEQIIRVISVYVIALYLGKGNQAMTCDVAVLGVVLGEIASNIFNVTSLFFEDRKKRTSLKERASLRLKNILKDLLKVSIPLTSNRLLISLLHSFEAVLLPIMLRKSGLSNAQALSIYGVLTGMVIPFILFPSTITNSFAVMLLPTVSEAQASKNDSLIGRTTAISIKYSLVIGILSTGIFMIFGNDLGLTIYANKTAGIYLVILSWLCPFLYLSTTLSSIINGLGKTHITFFNSVVGLSIRILTILFWVPKYGISGYLIGTLVSQLVLTGLDVFAIIRNIKVEFDAFNWLLKPSIIMAIVGYFSFQIYQYFLRISTISDLLLLFLSCIILTVSYIIFLFMSKTMTVKEFRQ